MPNNNGHNKVGFKVFISIALGVLAQIWDALTNSSESPPSEPTKKLPENNNPPSSDIPSFSPDYSKMRPIEKQNTPTPTTE